MSKTHIPLLARHLLLVVLITLIMGLVYGAVQQNYRQNANDPQIQLSEDTANILSNGASPQQLVPGKASTDMTKSLAPFVVIYDDSGKVVVATGYLDGSTPELPGGVLDYAKAHNQYSLTWQPKPSVRVAAVITRYSSPQGSGYVLVGRSLREVEKRIGELTMMVILAWAVCMGVIIIAAIFALWCRRKLDQLPKQSAETPIDRPPAL
jgi:hypothetical protein